MRLPSRMLEESVVDLHAHPTHNQPHQQQHACISISQKFQTPLAATLRLTFVILRIFLGLPVPCFFVLLAQAVKTAAVKSARETPTLYFSVVRMDWKNMPGVMLEKKQDKSEYGSTNLMSAAGNQLLSGWKHQGTVAETQDLETNLGLAPFKCQDPWRLLRALQELETF